MSEQESKAPKASAPPTPVETFLFRETFGSRTLSIVHINTSSSSGRVFQWRIDDIVVPQDVYLSVLESIRVDAELAGQLEASRTARQIDRAVYEESTT